MSDKQQTLTLPLLITRSLVLFPGNTQLIEAGREFSINAVTISKEHADSLLFVTSQKSFDTDNPTKDDVYDVGTLCRIIAITTKDDRLRVRVEVVERAALKEISIDEKDRCFVATGEVCPLPKENTAKQNAALEAINGLLETVPHFLSRVPRSSANTFIKTEDPAILCYAIASYLDLDIQGKQDILESNDLDSLVTKIYTSLKTESDKEKIETKLSQDVRESTEKSQKEYLLREKLKAIKKELGEETGDKSPESILEKLEANPYPEYIKKKVKSELSKFDMMPSGSLEGALIQSYVDVIMSLPWYQKTEDNDDLKNVEKILDEDHFGLENAKKRIIEYLAVKKLTGNLKSPILCFYGPPGTGKTSLGKSIARALGRKFFKASLGGISDEAEIRGHRRTYVGALPGRIIQGMKKAGVTNPVFLLDEVDKVATATYKGDPSSALLEVLDPEQNTAFNDNYVEEPYDLSDVLFICTANYLENIPGPLRDRLELIELSSYTELEKIQIAKKYLVAKQTEANGLKAEQVSISDEAIKFVINCYTRESGVRELERKIASCLRKVAVAIVKDPSITHIDIDETKVKEYLGVPLFEDSKKEKEPQIGVVTGLAYTQYGGDILPIEVNYFKGNGKLVLTGNLGDVMKESASIALDYVKSNAKHFKIDDELFEKNDIHIHVPEGAVPKDGPSAGVALTIAIISCLSKRPVSPDVAMTGEVTLRGNALPIGGLREKSLAALRSGIKTIIVPEENKKDVEELPKEVKTSLKIKFMKCVDDAVKVAIIDKKDD